MASRRITRQTFEAVVQDKVKRYRMERSDAAGDSIHRFKAHSRPPPRPRYNESFHHDGRFPHANSQHQDWSEDPGEEYPGEEYPGVEYPGEEYPGESYPGENYPGESYPGENYPGEDYPGESYPGESYPGENYPGENYPGPSYGAGSPLLRQENYFHEQFPRRERELGRDFGRPPPQNRELGRGAGPGREHGQHGQHGQHGRRYGREYGQPWEGGGAGFGSSELLGDFRSPGLLEEEYGEERGYRGRFRPPPRRGRVLRGKRPPRGAAKPKAFKGELKSPPKKWNVKKAQGDAPGLDQPPEGAERPGPGPPQQQQQQQQRPKAAPQPPAPQGPGPRLPKAAPRSLSFDPVDRSDIFSTFGVEIIKWAGFHAVRDDAEFWRLFGALFELETETCAKALASFKCSLRPEHRDYCFFTIKSLQHAALKTPKVDNEFLNMLLDKGAVKTKNCFFEVIKPFDKYVMRLQERLLKGVTPLLMACNAYELGLKSSAFGRPGDVAGALDTTVSLCRKSLALLGQTFALASVFRQEKILEAVGLQERAPAPTAFPNFDDSTLFGREYIENLKAWLEKSGCPIQVKRAEPREQLQESSPGSGAPQRADRKVLDTIEQLVSSIVSGALSAKDRNAQKNCPEYWFLCDEDSLEYKYFQLRLSQVQGGGLGGQGAAPEALRALLYARRVASIKRRLFRRKRKPGMVPQPRASRARRARRASTGTQTPLPAGHHEQELAQPAGSLCQHSPAMGVPPAPPGAPSPGPAGGKAEPQGMEVVPEVSLPLGQQFPDAAPELSSPLGSQFPDVDAKTMETAEKLAQFVAQVGPEIEQFSIDNSADNPELWFLQDQSSSAFKFYRLKVQELCPSFAFGPGAAGDGDEEEEEEEAELETPQAAGDEDEEDEDEDEDVAAGGREAELQEGLQDSREEASGAGAQPPGTPGSAGPRAPAPARRAPFPRKRGSKSLKVGIIPASKRVCLIEEPKVHEPVRIAYDRPRGCPVTKKKKKAKDVELPQKRLSPRNVGFQMLQRMGWQEGHGLGTRGRGIQEPVHLGATSAGEGLGVPGEQNQEDAFDVFRQRMIQMYRQKRASK